MLAFLADTLFNADPEVRCRSLLLRNLSAKSAISAKIRSMCRPTDSRREYCGFCGFCGQISSINQGGGSGSAPAPGQPVREIGELGEQPGIDQEPGAGGSAAPLRDRVDGGVLRPDDVVPLQPD